MESFIKMMLIAAIMIDIAFPVLGDLVDKDLVKEYAKMEILKSQPSLKTLHRLDEILCCWDHKVPFDCDASHEVFAEQACERAMKSVNAAGVDEAKLVKLCIDTKGTTLKYDAHRKYWRNKEPTRELATLQWAAASFSIRYSIDEGYQNEPCFDTFLTPTLNYFVQGIESAMSPVVPFPEKTLNEYEDIFGWCRESSYDAHGNKLLDEEQKKEMLNCRVMARGLALQDFKIEMDKSKDKLIKTEAMQNLVARFQTITNSKVGLLLITWLHKSVATDEELPEMTEWLQTEDGHKHVEEVALQLGVSAVQVIVFLINCIVMQNHEDYKEDAVEDLESNINGMAVTALQATKNYKQGQYNIDVLDPSVF